MDAILSSRTPDCRFGPSGWPFSYAIRTLRDDLLAGRIRSDRKPVPRPHALTERPHAVGLAEAVRGHVAVDRLVRAGGHEIGLVPDADVPLALARVAVDAGPPGLVPLAGGGRVREQLLLRLPVLDHVEVARVGGAQHMVEQAGRAILAEFPQHHGHR